DRAQSAGQIRNQETSKVEHHRGDQSSLYNSRKHAGDLPQVLRAPGGARKLCRSKIYRGLETNHRRSAGKGRCRSSLERSSGSEVFRIAFDEESRLAQCWVIPGGARDPTIEAWITQVRS